MSRVVQAYDNWSSRVANALSFWALVPAGAVGVVTAYLASFVEAVNRYGAFGWWSVGLIAFFLTSIALACIGLFREKISLVRAYREWPIRTDQINPLKETFEAERISISDLRHPYSQIVEGKSFSRCQLIGPANIAFMGHGLLQKLHYDRCEILIVRDDAPMGNVTVFQDCTLRDCSLVHCSIFVTQQIYEQMQAEMPGILALTYEKPNGN